MATTLYVNTVAAGGGNGTTNGTGAGGNNAYATLAAWYAAHPNDNLTGTGGMTVNCCGGADTSSALNLAGYVTTASDPLIIKANSGDATGKNNTANFNTSYYYLVNTGAPLNYVLRPPSNCTIDGLQITHTATSSGNVSISLSNTLANMTVRNCRFRNLATTASHVFIDCAGATPVTIINCTFSDAGQSNNVCVQISGNSTVTIMNCTMASGAYGVYIPAGSTTVAITNSAIFNMLSAVTLSGSPVISFCATPTGAGSSAQTIANATAWNANFTNYASGDFTPLSAAPQIVNRGTNTGAPATDIIGTVRPQETTVDIGAWEVISAPTVVALTATSLAAGAIAFGTAILAIISPAIVFHAAVADNGLNEIKNTATTVFVCNAMPADYAAASSTNKLGSAPISFNAPVDSVGAGRKITSNPVTGGAITGSGTVSHWAVTDGSRLLATGAVSSPFAVTNGWVFSLGALSLVTDFV